MTVLQELGQERGSVPSGFGPTSSCSGFQEHVEHPGPTLIIVEQ